MAQIHVGVLVKQLNKSLPCVSSCTNQRNLGGVVPVLVLDTVWRVGVSRVH